MEEKRQPLPPQHPAHVLAKKEKRRQQKEKLKRLLPVAALVTVLVVALIILIVVIAIPESDDWKSNILRSDEIPSDFDRSYSEYPVFGSGLQRNQISAVRFLDTQSGAPTNAWDVSESGDSSVMAWVEPDGDLYQLYIAGEGGVNAGASCRELFAGYDSMTQISFGGNFHTEAVQDMSLMFSYCHDLTSLDLRSFDTSAVQDMSGMFEYCYDLASLDLRSFDTAAVQDMSDMFYSCGPLTSLNLRSFDTAAVLDMRSMFSCCYVLTSLDLSKKFVTTNADTVDMFENCPAGEHYQHLLNN